MNIYEKLKVTPIINAVDSYTIIGGSLMPPEVLSAMSEAAQSFVSIEQLHDAVGQRLAELTRNEAAMVTSGAAAALAITTAACLTGSDTEKIEQLPFLSSSKLEVIIHRCQNNGFVHAIKQTGARVIEMNDVHENSTEELEGLISDRTACIVYFVSTGFEKNAIPLPDVISIAKKRQVPVIVDAAAQLPPVDNLWRYTLMGADMVIFSGGKTLRGPQSTGLVVGKTELIRACRLNSSPNVAIGRPMKVSKEEMVGLLAAVERYLNLDHDELSFRYEEQVRLICSEVSRLGLRAERLYSGPTGQSYARAAIYLAGDGKAISTENRSGSTMTAVQLKEALELGTPSIWVGITEDSCGIVINPLHLKENEIPIIVGQIEKIIGSV